MAPVAAWLALAFLVTAGAVLVSGALRNLLPSLLAVAGVLTAVTSGWYAVSRRGRARWLALGSLVASAGPLVAGILLADLRLASIILAIAAGALSVACARVALGDAGQRRQRTPSAAALAQRPARPVLVINPRSGGGKADKFGVAAECAARGIEPVLLQPGDDLRQLAVDAIARGADIIGMAGGDGSQALVASVAAERQIPFVVVPTGTRNHFALDLGLDRDDVTGALDGFGDAIERRVDLAEVNGRVFVNNASLGLYAKIIQSPGYRDAKLKTAADLLPALLGPDAEPIDLRFTGPDGIRHATAHLVLVSNNRYQLDHAGGRGTRESLDRGTLGVVTARIDGPAEARRLVVLDAVDQVRQFPGWLEWETPRFEIQSDSAVEIALDGEAMVLDPPLIFSSRPGSLVVRLPRNAPAASPAAAAIRVTSRSTWAELLAVAAGRGHG